MVGLLSFFVGFICEWFSEGLSLKVLRVVALLAVLSGCSTYDSLKTFTVPYQEPEEATSARLRVNTDQVVRLIPGRNCRDWSAPGAGVVNSRALALANNEDLNDKRIGMPPSDQPNNNSEVYVRPNEPLTIVYSGASGRLQCVASSYFIPEDNSDYEVSALFSPAGCYIAVGKLAGRDVDGKIVHKPAGAREAKSCK